MAARTLAEIIRHLRGAATAAGEAGTTDAQLLERFASGGDQDAFELLLWRHAGTVLGVCRRLLRDECDAEDALQATFLILARKAGSVGRRGSVGGWLYQVARRVALRARVGAAARATREGPLGDAEPHGGPGPADEAAWSELRAALDEQVQRLPAVYREAFVLRCLAGKSAEEAARELGCPAATVESRLARARQRLRERLKARGFAPAALGGAGPASWGVSEFTSAALAAAGRAAARGGVSPRAAALAGEVVSAMLMIKLKAAAVLVVLASALAGAGSLAWRPTGSEARADDRPALARTRVQKDKADKELERLREQVEELRRKLNDMQAGADVAALKVLLLERERKDLREELKRKRREIDGVLTRIDIAGNKVSLTLGDTKLALDGVGLSPLVKFSLDGKECTINDLKPGMSVSLPIEQEDGKAVATAVRARKPIKE
jgi:RNA polymerase sigma factor (sigma-70 family)